jgi:hypothetical protein
LMSYLDSMNRQKHLNDFYDTTAPTIMTACRDRPHSLAMTSKWSIKPDDHKAARLRNNQRRHRERVKNHAATLEARLEETQLQLQRALARISELTEELRLARALPAETTVSPVALSRTGDLPDTSAARDCEGAIFGGESCAAQALYELSAGRNPSSCVGRTGGRCSSQYGPAVHNPVVPDGGLAKQPSPILSGPYKEHIIPQSLLTVTYGKKVGAGEEDYENLPPPGPNESTTRCRDAIAIIEKQNYNGLDIPAIRERLQPGFRGYGCRVDNRLLFTLLDSMNTA